MAKAKERNAYLRSIIEEIQAEQGRAMTLSEMADALNTSGYRTARGKTFSRASIHRLYQQIFR